MKKVLIVSTLYPPYHLGGAELSTQILAENLCNNYEVTVLTHGHNSEEIINNVKVIRHDFGIGTKNILNLCSSKKNHFIYKLISKKRDILKWNKIINYYSSFLKEFKFDIIIYSGNCANMGRNNLIKVGHKKNIKQIFVLRDPLLLYFNNAQPSFILFDKIYRIFSKRIINYINCFVGITDNIVSEHLNKGFTFKNIRIIPNCVDTKLCVLNDEKENTILYVGAVSKAKGVHFLIDSFLKSSINGFNLKIIGKKIDVDIPKLDNIIYMGEKDIRDVYLEMSKAKLLVLPSIWTEAFGRVLVESVFNSTISIGSDSGGIPNILNNDKDYIFESQNYNDLLRLLKKYLFCDKKNYDLFYAKEKEYFSKFTIDNYINEYINLIEDIMR